ncbi:MAG TPA: LamG domain-containing protein [Chitinophagaceae bacterium]|jgi:tetratricopeptide (TPR) repeat protein|nr:LamG domain-containing protein [Chitinophagaceae bacterium]
MVFYKGYKSFLTCLLFYAGILSSSYSQQNDSSKIDEYNRRAIKLINQYKLDEAISNCDSAIRIMENARSYSILAFINNYTSNWKDAIKNGEKAIQIDSNSMETYPTLFDSYLNEKKWDDAIRVSEKAEKADPSGKTTEKLQTVIASEKNEKISTLIFWICFIILACIFLYPFFRAKENFKYSTQNNYLRVSAVIFLTSAISLILFILFFSLSKWIWSFNPRISAAEFTSSVRAFIFEHDGAETLFLYLLMFFNIAISMFITRWILNLKLSKNQYLTFSIILIAIAGYYFYNIGFTPPVSVFVSEDEPSYALIIFGIALLSFLLFFLYTKYKVVVKLVVFLLIAFTSLVLAYPTSLTDLSYILAPASRLANGIKTSNIYFQYDMFLSILGWCWLKLNLGLEWFSYLAQLSFLLFFIGCFIFSDHFFKTKGLSVLFILALLLVRYYAVRESGFSVFQTAPLRLDLWLILLLVIYFKGVQHWLAGLCLGLLIIFHRNLGLIYMGSYFALLLFLFVADIAQLFNQKGLTFKSFYVLFIKYLRLHAINLSLIVASVLLCILLFGELFPSSAMTYRKYGIGMLPISRDSFYWYVPIILSSLTVVLFYYKKYLTDKYYSTAMFIITLAIGNSMYFFGRSHENNILNISGILVLALFVLFDVLIFSSTEFIKKSQPVSKKSVASKSKSRTLPKRFFLAMPFLFIILCTYYYAPRIHEKISNQYDNLSKGQFTYPIAPGGIDTVTIKEITHRSDKVYFLDFRKDFYYYYYGHYPLVGYFNPASTWIFKKDLTNFMQDLLNKQYYIVFDADKFASLNEYLPNLRYNASVEKNNFIAIQKETVPYILSKDANELFHLAIRDSLSHKGLDYSGLFLEKNFTIEVVMKPTGNQLSEATIFSNLSNSKGIKGIALQQNNSTPDQYVFAMGDGSMNVHTLFFSLENNKWHYLTITADSENINVYDYGKLLATAKLNGSSLLNNDIPLTIANRQNRDAHFNGYIREIKMRNGTTSGEEIIKKGADLSNFLNLGASLK